MKWFNAERLRTVLTFPVETVTLLYKDGKFLDEEMFKFVCDEYARGHSFFTYISDSVDSLSSCCRLKNKLQTKEFSFTNGNVGIQTGSKSVITFNLNRLIQMWYRKESDRQETQFKFDESCYPSLKKYLSKLLDRVYKYHHAYNELLWDMYDANLLPAYRAGFIDLNKQYLTLGLNGLNQAAEFLGMDCSINEEYSRFCQEIFSFFKEQNELHTDKTSKHHLIFNTEQVPAESLARKNYIWDHDDGYWVPDDTNLYASYVFKPNDTTISVLDKIKMHGKEYIGEFLDGGAACHLNLDSHLSYKQYKQLLNYAARVGCSYLTFNIPMTECNDCGKIVNAPINECPECHSKNLNYYTRIIGYLTAVKNWNDGRKKEFETRVFNRVEEDDSGEYIKFNKYKAK
jgi:ribonucleoside-triphosphate reductase